MKLRNAILALPLLASCSVSAGSFKEVKEEEREEKILAFEAARNEAKISMPSKFTIIASRTSGVEADRNPLFGNIVYSEKPSLSRSTTVYMADADYVHFTLYGYDASSKSETQLDKYVFVRGKNLIDYSEITNPGTKEKIGDPVLSEKAYENSRLAREAFAEYIANDTEPAYRNFNATFDAQFDDILPSYQASASEKAILTVAERENFPGDLRLDLTLFKDNTHKEAQTKISAIYEDYACYYYHCVSRKGSETIEINMSKSNEVELYWPTI